MENSEYDVSKVLSVLGNNAFADIFVKPNLNDSGIKYVLKLISDVLKIYNFNLDNVNDKELSDMKNRVEEILNSVPENRGSFGDWCNKISNVINSAINYAGGDTGTEKFANLRETVISKITGIKADSSVTLENIEKKLSLK